MSNLTASVTPLCRNFGSRVLRVSASFGNYSLFDYCAESSNCCLRMRNILPLPIVLFFGLALLMCSGKIWGQGAALIGDAKAHYVLGTGDRIFIQVFDEPDLTMDALVNDSGVINYSYVGSVQVAGKTLVEIEQEITAILSDGYLVSPSVNVSMREYRPFFINGEVRQPGGYPYQPGLTVDRAIAIAGGLTDRASKRKMFLVSDSQKDGKRRKVSMNATVEPGDIITIDEGFF